MKDFYDIPALREIQEAYRMRNTWDIVYGAMQTPQIIQSALEMQQRANEMAAIYRDSVGMSAIREQQRWMQEIQAVGRVEPLPAAMFMNSGIHEMAETFRVSDFLRYYPEAQTISERLSQIWDVGRMANFQTVVPVEGALAMADEIRPYLPEEAAEAVDAKIETAEQASNQIPWKTIMEIITFVICVLGFVKDCLPDEHQERQEATNSAIIAKQEEMLQLQKAEAERSEEFRQRAEEHFKITEEAYERIAQALEVLADQSVEIYDEGQQLIDLPDLPDDTPEKNALDKADDGQN